MSVSTANKSLGERIDWEVEQIKEAVNYYVELWETVKSPETKYEIEVKIRKLKNKARRMSADNE